MVEHLGQDMHELDRGPQLDGGRGGRADEDPPRLLGGRGGVVEHLGQPARAARATRVVPAEQHDALGVPAHAAHGLLELAQLRRLRVDLLEQPQVTVQAGLQPAGHAGHGVTGRWMSGTLCAVGSSPGPESAVVHRFAPGSEHPVAHQSVLSIGSLPSRRRAIVTMA